MYKKVILCVMFFSLLLLAGCGSKEVSEIDNSKEISESNSPISYSLEGVDVIVKLDVTSFDYTVETLKNYASECSNEHEDGYFEELVDSFKDSKKAVYNFKYQGESQDSDTFRVTILPNLMDYKNIDAFKKDFDQCFAGGDAYPTKLSKDWLLFVNSCGSGYSDGSGRPLGCDVVQKVVSPSLKFK